MTQLATNGHHRRYGLCHPVPFGTDGVGWFEHSSSTVDPAASRPGRWFANQARTAAENTVCRRCSCREQSRRMPLHRNSRTYDPVLREPRLGLARPALVRNLPTRRLHRGREAHTHRGCPAAFELPEINAILLLESGRVFCVQANQLITALLAVLREQMLKATSVETCAAEGSVCMRWEIRRGGLELHRPICPARLPPGLKRVLNDNGGPNPSRIALRAKSSHLTCVATHDASKMPLTRPSVAQYPATSPTKEAVPHAHR